MLESYLIMTAISEEQRKSWQDLIEGVDMSQNSKKAWSTTEQVNNDPKQAIVHSNATAIHAGRPSSSAEW